MGHLCEGGKRDPEDWGRKAKKAKGVRRLRRLREGGGRLRKGNKRRGGGGRRNEGGHRESRVSLNIRSSLLQRCETESSSYHRSFV